MQLTSWQIRQFYNAIVFLEPIKLIIQQIIIPLITVATITTILQTLPQKLIKSVNA